MDKVSINTENSIAICYIENETIMQYLLTSESYYYLTDKLFLLFQLFWSI